MTETLANGYSSENTNMAGFTVDGFQIPLQPCALDESSLSIGRVKSMIFGCFVFVKINNHNKWYNWNQTRLIKLNICI